MCIYSRKIVKQSCETAKLDEVSREKVFKHVLTLEHHNEPGGHILELRNLSRRDVKSMMKNGIEFSFNKEHEQPGAELIPLTNELLRDKSFMAMQKERKNLLKNSTEGVIVNDNSLLYGVVVSSVTHVKDLCIWIANNK